MSALNRYLRLPHPVDCACSVCWSKSQAASNTYLPLLCNQCLPVRLSQEAGRWYVTRPSPCAKHKPSLRAPRYWHVIYDSGKPTPYVPLFE
ncbi:hypothetical protein CW360_07065 [Pseudomonas fluvialis]|uniref:Uncharacterized protein n=1 Tax=Pseudomonas fluvialis TaxID=1793966 RepID=A0A2I0CR86_9PSED|nr:DUF5447 family protein [Pseudomonas pharmacofabricae]PKF71652.1 hypothetical protein CW360_07065 [Pseudomonas pharmacofabricae]